MQSFRTQKLVDAIVIQSKLSKSKAIDLAKVLVKKTNWDQEFNYHEIAGRKLEELGLLRSQNTKSCNIRRGTRMK